MLLKKLVIAEDDDAVAHLVSARLGDAGYLCLRARDGEEALNLVRTELPDLLVLDVMMPNVDGFEVCRRLKSDVLLSRVPILMLTSLAEVDNRVAGLDAGADDYLTKPFDSRELAARIKALIRQSRRERDRNPTTNLPSGEAVEEQVQAKLSSREAFALLYLDIENFRSYADVFGFRKADDVINSVGKLIINEARAVASETAPFVGHVGGDDFMILCEPDVAGVLGSSIHQSFAATVDDYYEDSEDAGSFIEAVAGMGTTRNVQLMNMSVALINVAPGAYRSMEELANEIARVKSETRQPTGSAQFLVPRRPSESSR